MEKLENMIGKTYYRPLPKINSEIKTFIVQEVRLVKKRNTYYWGGEQCHHSWLIEDALVYFETKEECQDACYKYEYEKKYVDINKDNIHLYYKFMNDEDLIQNSEILNDLLVCRFHKICSLLSVSAPMLHSYSSYNYYNAFFVKQFIFGIKDNLNPIEDFIEDIKNSNEYKSFISKAS